MFPNIWTEIVYWAIGVPFLILSELVAVYIAERWYGRYKTMKATLEMLQKLAKKPGYKRVARQAIAAIKETAEHSEEKDGSIN